MIGFIEEKYEVIKRETINVGNRKQIIEVRKQEEDSDEFKAKLKEYEEIVKKRGGIVEKADKSAYISLIAEDQSGKVVMDFLFYYEESDEDKKKERLLEEDFAMLTDPETIVDVKKLNAYKRIEFHHTGYTKSGSVMLY